MCDYSILEFPLQAVTEERQVEELEKDAEYSVDTGGKGTFCLGKRMVTDRDTLAGSFAHKITTQLK